MAIDHPIRLNPQRDSKQVTALLSCPQPGYSIVSFPCHQLAVQMASDVKTGLSKRRNKSLPCIYFYDEHGSQLYEQITALPEYYPTRTEAALLTKVAPILVNQLGNIEIVELGSGSSAKTRLLLEAWDANQQALTYIPIDVSETILTESAEGLTAAYKKLMVLGLAGDFETGLAMLPPNPKRLFLFLGGTLGNFTPATQRLFFTRLAKQMGKGAKLLLGFDRQPHHKKPVQMIHNAYNDAAGITQAFNLNMLSHINHRLGADFSLTNWQHRAIYNEQAHQIEMYLDSLSPQDVFIDALQNTFVFEKGDTVLTEISRKFDPQALCRWFEKLGYRCLGNWTDPKELFGLLLLEA